MLQKIRILKEHIIEKSKEAGSKRINCIVQKIKENVDNESKIWKLKRKLENKFKTPNSIRSIEEIKLEKQIRYTRGISQCR